MKASEGGGGGGGGGGGSQVQKIFQMLFGGGGGGGVGGGVGGPTGGAPQIAGPGLGQSPINQILQQIFGGTNMIGGIDIPPADMHDPTGGLPIGMRDVTGPGLSDWADRGYDPGWRPNMFNNFYNQPGMPWSPTAIPTSYDPQGYPYAVPVFGPPAAIWTDPAGPVVQQMSQ